MSTSGTKKNGFRKQASVSLFISVFLAVFGMIYEHFSHEVYSMFMIYAFMFPLILGTVIPLLLSFLFSGRQPGHVSSDLWFSGIATLTVGSIMKGVLDIYGTTNRLNIIYLVVGMILAAAGIIAFAIENTFRRK